MKLYEQKIKKILILLEKSVVTDLQIDQSGLDEIEVLAKKHVGNVKKLEDLDAQIQVLLAKKEKIEDTNEVIKDEIQTMIGETKSQSYRFGKILVDFKITKTEGVTKSAPQWKNITNSLVETYKIEEKIVNDLVSKFNNGNKPFIATDKTLNITKESKQLRENFLRTIWMSVKSVFTGLFKSFRSQNDNLENLLIHYKRTLNKGNVDLEALPHYKH